MMKNMPPHELLQILPLLQKLLERMTACVPQGSACFNEVVLQALRMVLSEAGKVYRAVQEGMLNLLDKFFEMERTDASRGLSIYKENNLLNEKLNEYWVAVQGISGMRGAVSWGEGLKPPPEEFLQQMEEYCKGAPYSVGGE